MSTFRRQKWAELTSLLKGYSRVLVSFSGGCDSTFLLAAARRTLGKENVLAVTALSESLPATEQDACRRLAEELDVSHLCVQTHELDNPSYAANPSNRCFFCKDELFQRLAPLAEERRMVLVDGFNASDRSDYRPGLQAAQQWRVSHPLDAAELFKRDIRVFSRWLRLETWNKPSSPCLSSRVPYGTPVQAAVLKQIEKAEQVLHDEGFAIVRVRHFGAEARIEVDQPQLPRLFETERWRRIVGRLRALGYEDVIGDPRGYQSGRLNEPLAQNASREKM